MDECYYSKKSGQIPAFGDWENANDMPITQYFECARQAGLVRYSSSSGENDIPSHYFHGGYGGGDLYARDLNKRSRNLNPPTKTTRERRGSHSKEHRRQGRVYDASEPTSKAYPNRTKQHQSNAAPPPRQPHKPVDEDLYKIPPELLDSSKRKRMPGFFTCLVPCAT